MVGFYGVKERKCLYNFERRKGKLKETKKKKKEHESISIE